MNDKTNEDNNREKNINVNTNTSLDDVNISRFSNVNTAKIQTNDVNEPSLFSANNIHRKMSDNLARAEAMTDEKPLWTEKTVELEGREEEDNE